LQWFSSSYGFTGSSVDARYDSIANIRPRIEPEPLDTRADSIVIRKASADAPVNDSIHKVALLISKRRILLAAAAVIAVIGTGFATRSRGRHHRAIYDAQYESGLRIWENEGGSVPFIRATNVRP
jgi:hypothetical protein